MRKNDAVQAYGVFCTAGQKRADTEKERAVIRKRLVKILSGQFLK